MTDAPLFNNTSVLLLETLTDPLTVACFIIDILILLRLLKRPLDFAAALQKFRSLPWSIREIGILFLLIVSSISYGNVIFWSVSQIWKFTDAQADAFQLIAQTLFFHIPILAMVFLLVRIRKDSSEHLFGCSWRSLFGDIGKGLAVCIGAIPLVGITNLLVSWMLTNAGFEQENQYAILILMGDTPEWQKYYVLVTGIITAPLMEELVFRGIALPALSKRLGIGKAVLLVSILFSCIHLNLFALAPLFVLALIISASYVLTGSLTVPITIHTVYNAITICFVLAGHPTPG